VLLFYQGKVLATPHPSPHQSNVPFEPCAISYGGLHAYSFASSGAEAPDGGPPAWIPLICTPQDPLWSEILSRLNQTSGPVFLGLTYEDGAAVFACQVDSLPYQISQAMEVSRMNGGSGVSLVGVRSEGKHMTGEDAGVLAHAAGLLQWHGATVYNSLDGEKTVPSS